MKTVLSTITLIISFVICFPVFAFECNPNSIKMPKDGTLLVKAMDEKVLLCLDRGKYVFIGVDENGKTISGEIETGISTDNGEVSLENGDFLVIKTTNDQEEDQIQRQDMNAKI
ncbi:MAG: hypothetical protein US57_C0017G0004 [Candidatus Moranbacteria bacterium GW2011_GWC2_37_73]|nr:MAG: hypothetical protein US09_C0015G0010 [Candidatus Moranbacteria bacterium GW2011_GWD1_36_198]KKQ00721.1 MAG: hypothetical protein US10_C0027G0004 [Candidatus Moranbacteria bacterium GW2011_GWD2_36_198]KKQ39205.1 MAG: hypothetical protein US57_C0017G0004 [Candidatus Moranbacteria bacterium GW2011_GWC2_37_73]